MEKKNDKLIGINMHFIKNRILIIIVLLFYHTSLLLYSADPITVWPVEIKFNYEIGSSTNDAVTLYSANNTPTAVPEWKYNERNERIAYYIGQTGLKIQVRFGSTASNMNYMVKATVIYGTGIGNVCETFIGDCEIGQWITLNLSGTVPGPIGIKTFRWQWEVTAIPLSAPYCPVQCSSIITEHSYYNLFDAPKEPMHNPWISVLNYAFNKIGGIYTQSEVISAFTTSLYNSGVEYGSLQYYTTGYNDFNLTSLLSDLQFPENVYMDCRDFSNFLNVLTNALGISGQFNRIGSYFNYNYILPAGWPQKYSGSWSFHQVGWYNSKVADAAAKIDDDSDPTSSPHTWRLVVGDVSMSYYLNKLTEDDLVESEGIGTCNIIF